MKQKISGIEIKIEMHTWSFEYPTRHQTGSTKWKAPTISKTSGTRAPRAPSMAQRAWSISKLKNDAVHNGYLTISTLGKLGALPYYLRSNRHGIPQFMTDWDMRSGKALLWKHSYFYTIADYRMASLYLATSFSSYVNLKSYSWICSSKIQRCVLHPH